MAKELNCTENGLDSKKLDVNNFVKLFNQLPDREKEDICFFIRGVLFAVEARVESTHQNVC